MIDKNNFPSPQDESEHIGELLSMLLEIEETLEWYDEQMSKKVELHRQRMITYRELDEYADRIDTVKQNLNKRKSEVLRAINGNADRTRAFGKFAHLAFRLFHHKKD